MLIGVISDTHGMVHPKAFGVFEGVDHILHAGDIGSEEVLIELRALAPVTAIHGNADPFDMQTHYPSEETVMMNGVTLLLCHQAFRGTKLLGSVKSKAQGKGANALIFGHTHIAFCKVIDGILFFNPGGGGKKRFSLPRSVGILEIDANRTIHPRLRQLDS
jgi:putative phosphoesterase